MRLSHPKTGNPKVSYYFNAIQTEIVYIGSVGTCFSFYWYFASIAPLSLPYMGEMVVLLKEIVERVPHTFNDFFFYTFFMQKFVDICEILHSAYLSKTSCDILRQIYLNYPKR